LKPKRENTEPETLESHIRDDQSAGLDRRGFEAPVKLCGPVPKRIERLLDDKDPFAGGVRNPRAMRWLADKDKVTIGI